MNKINLCKNWKVKKIDSKENYKLIDIPYDAMIFEKRIDDAASGKNCCWFDCHDYEFIKELEISENLKGRDLILEFEGVYHNATFFLNNEKIHFRPYGYTNFYVDITHKVKYGEKNILKVIAYNSDQPNSRWYSGCGIYRPVYLYDLNHKRVEINGIHVKTTDFTTKTIQTIIKTSCPGDIKIEVLNQDKVISSKTIFTYGVLGETFTLSELSLWDVNNPNLYTLRVTFEGEIYEEKFGIRQIAYGNKGLFINGKREILYGACIHSDNQLLGAITNKSAEVRRVKILKKAGYNAIRSAHNPISKYLLEACDELGMYVLDEYVDCWTTHKTKFDYVTYLKDYWQEDLTDMVNKDFNHPSVIMYSTGNEVGESSKKEGIELTKTFTSFLHSLDRTRPVTCGINIFYNFLASVNIGFYNDKKAEKEEIKNKGKKKKRKSVGSEFFNDLTNLLGAPTLAFGAKLPMCDKATRGTFANVDIAGYNYGILRYEHDLQKYPNRLILGSETFCKDARLFYKLAQNNPRIVGDFVRAGMDYLGEVGVGSYVDASDCDNNMTCGAGWMSAGSGRVDLIGSELAEASYTKVAFEKETIKMGVISPKSYKAKTTKSSWKFSRALESYSFDGCENMETEVEVYSTGHKVALFLNNVEVDKQKTNKNAINRFKIKYIPGTLKAISYNKNGEIIGECVLKTAQNSTKITLVAENPEIYIDDFGFVKIKYTDKDEILKPLYNKIVVVTVEGGKLEALGNACPYSKEGYHNIFTKTYFGEALAIVKPLENSKEIKINVTDGELENSIIIKVK